MTREQREHRRVMAKIQNGPNIPSIFLVKNKDRNGQTDWRNSSIEYGQIDNLTEEQNGRVENSMVFYGPKTGI